jgi:uncharacterized membrane protein YeaQ/YmgE (transglycosylase-associated protein family)
MLSWLIVGLIAGWLAGQIFHGRGYGMFMDIVLGLVGSVIGGWIFGALGIVAFGFIDGIAMSTVGAVALVGAAHVLRAT